MQALATHPAVVTGLLQHRPETSVCRPCVAHTVLPRPSFPSVLPGLVGRSHIPTALPTAFPVTCTGVSRPVTVSSALPGGTAHAKFLEVVSTEGITITQATPEYYSSCITASDRKALKKVRMHCPMAIVPWHCSIKMLDTLLSAASLVCVGCSGQAMHKNPGAFGTPNRSHWCFTAGAVSHY
jgi:hypothetical protein